VLEVPGTWEVPGTCVYASASNSVLVSTALLPLLSTHSLNIDTAMSAMI